MPWARTIAGRRGVPRGRRNVWTGPPRRSVPIAGRSLMLPLESAFGLVPSHAWNVLGRHADRPVEIRPAIAEHRLVAPRREHRRTVQCRADHSLFAVVDLGRDLACWIDDHAAAAEGPVALSADLV